VAAELPTVRESIADFLSSHVIFLVQGSSLDQIGDIQIWCIPPTQLEEPTLLTMAVTVEGGPSDGPHNGLYCSEAFSSFPD